MKKSISKCSLKISNALSLAITLFLCCHSSVAQQKVTTIIQTITPKCPQNDIDRYKLEVVNHGDTDAYWNLQDCFELSKKYNSPEWYREYIQYTAIMALKYEHVPACRSVYYLISKFHKGNSSKMSTDEVILCNTCLQIGIRKGDQRSKSFLSELLKGNPSPGTTLLPCCNSSVAQQKDTTIIQAITPECTQDDINCCKIDVISFGDTNAYWELQDCYALKENHYSPEWYTEIMQYTAIMALKYEYVPACRAVYFLAFEFHKKNSSKMSVDEVILCNTCLQIGIRKGDQRSKSLLSELFKENPSLGTCKE